MKPQKNITKRFNSSLVLRGFVVSALVLCLPAALFPQTVYTTAQSPFPLEDLGHSARGHGFGGAFTAVQGDLACLFLNPAGLDGLGPAQVSFLHQDWIGDMAQETLVGALPLGKAGAFALGANYLNGGSFQGYDSNGFPTSSYHPSRASLALGWGGSILPPVSLGFTLRGLSQSLVPGNQTMASALNLGVLWRVLPALRAGAFYSSLDTDAASPEWGLLKMGVSYSQILIADSPCLFLADASLPPHGVYRIQCGAEQLFFRFLTVRMGYQLELEGNQIGGFRGFTAGVGFRFQELDLDYCYVPDGDLGYSQLVGLTYRFPMETAKPVPTVSAIPLIQNSRLNTQNPGLEETPLPTFTPLYAPAPNPTPALTWTPTPTIPPLTPSLSFKPSNNRTASDQVVKVEIQFNLPDVSGGTSPLPQPSPSVQLQQAIENMAKKVQDNPQDVQSWINLGNLYWRAGQADFSVQCFEEALRLQPDMARLKTWLDQYNRLHPR